MSEQFYNTIWFDPGGTTGWALVSLHEGVIGPEPFDLWLAAREYNRGGSAGESDPDEELEAARIEWKAEVVEQSEYSILDIVAFWAVGQFTGRIDAQVDAMLDLVEAWPADTVLGCEDFILRQFRMDRMLLEPVRVTERFRQVIRDTGPAGRAWRPGVAESLGFSRANVAAGPRDVLLQPASIALSTITDDRLKRMNSADGRQRQVYFNGTAGAPHARDALRHAFTFLRREKEARSLGKSLHLKGFLKGLV
jgi:hypothetical protein